VEIEAKDRFSAVTAFDLSAQMIAEGKNVVLLDAFGRPRKRLPARADFRIPDKALDQRHIDRDFAVAAARGAPTRQLRWDNFRIVEHEKIAAFQEARQIGNGKIAEGVAVDMEKARAIARARRFEGDPVFG